MCKVNINRIKELEIRPERVRQFVTEIESQEINVQALRIQWRK